MLARVLAIAGLAVGIMSLGFNFWKEWWRGKRIRVELKKADTGGRPVLVVNAHNAGNTSATVMDWGFRVSGAGRGRILPPNTGVPGPELPMILTGSQPLDPPLSMVESELVSHVRSKLNLSAGEIKVRAYVERDGGTRVLSRRRDAVRLQL